MPTYNDEMIAKALSEALAADIIEYQKIPDHKFSRRFRLKMKKQKKGNSSLFGKNSV